MKRKDTIIVKCLIENKNEELNILKISKFLKMDYKNVYSIIKRLEKELLVEIETFGHSSRIKLNRIIHPLIFEAEFERRKDILRDKNIAAMLGSLKRTLNHKLYIILLFGSYAKRTQTKNSDIDLMVICPDGLEEAFEQDVDKVVKSMPMSLHMLVFSEIQYAGMLNSEEQNVGQEAFKNNVILYGIEQYYFMTRGTKRFM